ncbi:uncharacterized protein DEA37_0000199, partial [Paragonimus westermani]
NSNLVYTLIRKRQVFYHLANLPTDQSSIQRIVSRRIPRSVTADLSDGDSPRASQAQIVKPPTHLRTVPSPQTSTIQQVTPGNSTQPNGSLAGKVAPIGRSASLENHIIPNGDSLKTGSPNALQATLADTPEVGNMTDQRLANVGAQQPPHDFPSSNGMENSLENVLVSHSSPSRRNRSLSETATHTKSDSSPSNEESDGLSSVPLNHPGIAQSSLLNESAVDSTAVSKTKEIGKKPCHSDKPVTCKPERSLRGSAASTTATDRTCSPFPGHAVLKTDKSPGSSAPSWVPTPEWVLSWKAKMPFQTIMRLLQVLVPQVEKICIDK